MLGLRGFVFAPRDFCNFWVFGLGFAVSALSPRILRHFREAQTRQTKKNQKKMIWRDENVEAWFSNIEAQRHKCGRGYIDP